MAVAACTFCSVRNFNGVGVRQRSIPSIIEELRRLRDEHNIGHIMWLDDDFLYNGKRAIELFDAMIEADLGITWDCTNGVLAASITKDEMLEKMKQAGCIGFNIGMESGNPEILKNVKKPASVPVLIKAAETVRRHPEINARVFLIIGFPGETYRQILDTITVAQEMNLDWYNITILQPLPNTPIFDQMVAEGLIDDVSFDEIRYNSGAYGKHRKAAESNDKKFLSSEFADVFSVDDLDTVPPQSQLDDIWAYMNYHLNFKRLFNEDRPVKLQQQLNYVQNLTDLICPENAFAMYFSAFLQFKVSGIIDEEKITILEGMLHGSEYWREKFSNFNLSIEHLRNKDFPQAAALIPNLSSDLEREQQLNV